MARLIVHVEGQTEEAFVNEILQDYLLAKGYGAVSARIVGNARLRRHRGGIKPWPSVRKDIINHLKQDHGCIATTMVDYYALPKDGDGAWPGRADAAASRSKDKPAVVENALLNDVVKHMAPSGAGRFIPFVIMHEFEALLFSDCSAFSRGIGRPELEPELKRIRKQFPTPEDINDSPATAPSKRVQALIPGYEKPLLGVIAVFEIGLNCIRAECPHFDHWLTQLEARAK
jgi:hypothetical protein